MLKELLLILRSKWEKVLPTFSTHFTWKWSKISKSTTKNFIDNILSFSPHFLKPAIPMSVCSKVLDFSYFCCVSNFPSSVHLFCEKFNGALLRTLFSHCPWTLPPSRRRRCQTFSELLKKSVSVFILGSYKRIFKSKSLNRAPVKARHKNRKTIDLIVCRDCWKGEIEIRSSKTS